MRLSPLIALAAACALTLTACGDDGSDPKSSDKSESPSASSSDTPSKDEGSKGKDSKKKKPKLPDLGSADICAAVDAEAVGEVIGAEVKRSPAVRNTCTFLDPKNPSGQSVALTQVALDAVGGADAVATSFGAIAEGEVEEVPDVGEQAFLVVGTGATGSLAAAGAVVVDDSVIQVSMTPGAGAGGEEVRDQVTDLLKLVVDAA